MIEGVQKLRDLTGAGVMDCKNALSETKGNFDAAVKLIKERGLLKAQKRADRETGAGVLETYIHNERVGVMLELRCETDFVARSQIFKDLAHKLAMQIAAMSPVDSKELMSQPFIKDESETVESLVKTIISNVGENIEVARFTRYEL